MASPPSSAKHSRSMARFIVYINGFPGVGKLTIARLLQQQQLDTELIHNHELIDPVEGEYPRTHPLYAQKRAEYRRTRLIQLDPERPYIFTDSQTEYNDCVWDYVEASKGRRFYSVVLECGEEENVKRLTSEEREGGKLKDPNVLLGFRKTLEVYRFGGDDEIVIDVSKLEPEEAAKKVEGFVREREKMRDVAEGGKSGSVRS